MEVDTISGREGEKGASPDPWLTSILASFMKGTVALSILNHFFFEKESPN